MSKITKKREQQFSESFECTIPHRMITHQDKRATLKFYSTRMLNHQYKTCINKIFVILTACSICLKIQKSKGWMKQLI